MAPLQVHWFRVGLFAMVAIFAVGLTTLIVMERSARPTQPVVGDSALVHMSDGYGADGTLDEDGFPGGDDAAVVADDDGEEVVVEEGAGDPDKAAAQEAAPDGDPLANGPGPADDVVDDDVPGPESLGKEDAAAKEAAAKEAQAAQEEPLLPPPVPPPPPPASDDTGTDEASLHAVMMKDTDGGNLHKGGNGKHVGWKPPDLRALISHLHSRLKAAREGRVNFCGWEAAARENTFIPGCSGDGCKSFGSLKEAKTACEAATACGGITATSATAFELRGEGAPMQSGSNEMSYKRKDCGDQDPRASGATRLWEDFHKAVEEVVDDPRFHLNKNPPFTMDDAGEGTIFVSVASYRDHTCPETVRSMFAMADDPSKISVGLIQQNCNADCVTGTGWAETRRIVPQPEPDPDCFKAFCAQPQNAVHCKSGRLRAVRMNETESFGPFFARYMASKLWRGETAYVQIDAHSHFGKGWDTLILEQLRKTRSWPKSVISNYPPSADAFDVNNPRSSVPGALCGATFEDGDDVLRLQQAYDRTQHADGVPTPSSFSSAGFFAAGGNVVVDVPFDPYLPFLFMGEESILSARFWTNGYDIFAPIHDVCAHDYVRKESSKFWETVNRVFLGTDHNAVTSVVALRLKYLLEYPTLKKPDVYPASLLSNPVRYGMGDKRPLKHYYENIGIDFQNRQVPNQRWCTEATMPPYYVGDGK